MIPRPPRPTLFPSPTLSRSNPYPVKWTKLNLGANIQQGDFGHRGEQGLFESVGFQLFNLAGVPASRTAPVHFRIVEHASQGGPDRKSTRLNSSHANISYAVF